ncbi:hypothetical protein KKE03_02160 [Patescibacteria group bacterium]|nr:hypothetical protein [Patescibacteria group bacterium]
MSNQDFSAYALYFAIIVPVFGGLIGVFFLIPKFNPKRQYSDLKMSATSKRAIKLYLQAIIAFVVGFGGIIALLYFVMTWLGKMRII